MAATTQALIGQYEGSSTVATAFPQVTPNGVGNQNLDLIQIVSPSGSVLVNVDYEGTVHKAASGQTTGAADNTRIGVFYTRLTSSSSLAAIFADAFSNPSQLDIIQVINPGGNVHYWLDYLGVAHGS